MRLRHKPWAKEKLTSYPHFVIGEPEKYKGAWHSLFGNHHPIHIEIGTGKGRFITEMAKKNPHINYIGMEKQDRVIVSALDRVLNEEKLTNIRLINENADHLLSFFSKGEVARIYLNFSDPWPKSRHEKRRLTYHSFLERYKEIVTKNGEIHFKTDNRQLFEYSLESFSRFGMLLKNISLDLHKDALEDHVMTEYEEKFSGKGNRIYRCEAVFN
ncbi:tRNA (guanosine(46)-N7)-methyltransferase TrmB [Pueribacillus theae]|uniref:tRNA (guanine-N(7)-)-methyltransferase n=1 Tax=Pueribacillus theae TaxID=2171751 RepID=A0A2U1JXF8_9BACI|nr:tRNA (guanosine(46)-N7)-methyltransferase TrmB [Pueribacillus theae]PWA09488.1 tRNA (guanosine(46)-N7)-methyltransferase TrmB [Pueribacillus theae]